MAINNIIDDRYDEVVKIRNSGEALIIAIELQDRFESHLSEDNRKRLVNLLGNDIWVIEEIDRKKGYRISAVNPKDGETMEIKYPFADKQTGTLFDSVKINYEVAA